MALAKSYPYICGFSLHVVTNRSISYENDSHNYTTNNTVSILTVSLWFHFFLIAIWMYNVHLFPLCSPFSRHYSVVLSKMVFRPCLLGPPTLPNIFIHNASNQNYILYLLFNICQFYTNTKLGIIPRKLRLSLFCPKVIQLYL